ncbi:MAG: ECF-type sigma factor [Planctomycetota bacterium]
MASDAPTEELTLLLNAAGSGDAQAAATAWTRIYGEVHGMAERACRAENRQATLQPTLVVHELFLRLFGSAAPRAGWDDRRHFWGSVARAMSQFLIDHARAENAKRRGGGRARVDIAIVAGECADPTVALSEACASALEALDRLERESPETAQVARLRFLSGFSVEQTSEILGIAPRTVSKRWTFAQAWLRRALDEAA